MTNLKVTYAEIESVADSILQCAEYAEAARNSSFSSVQDSLNNVLVAPAFSEQFNSQFNDLSEGSSTVIIQFKDFSRRLNDIAEGFRQADAANES